MRREERGKERKEAKDKMSRSGGGERGKKPNRGSRITMDEDGRVVSGDVLRPNRLIVKRVFSSVFPSVPSSLSDGRDRKG